MPSRSSMAGILANSASGASMISCASSRLLVVAVLEHDAGHFDGALVMRDLHQEEARVHVVGGLQRLVLPRLVDRRHDLDARVVAVDKTSTLTDLEVLPGFERAETLAVIAAVEAKSEHPIARAIAEAAEAEGLAWPEVTSFSGQNGEARDPRRIAREERPARPPDPQGP